LAFGFPEVAAFCEVSSGMIFLSVFTNRPPEYSVWVLVPFPDFQPSSI